MPKLSDSKRERISEQILFFLYHKFPELVFTSDVACDLARDEEFVKSLLLELESKGFVVRVDKNASGVKYRRRIRWRISNRAYDAYRSQS